MQTLQTGSFLRLENDSAVESLKFTARLLAEHTEKVVKENLNAASLENLANNLWQKAEYVTLDAERRRLREIFVENFTERFRELKPDFDALTNEIANLLNQTAAPEKVEVKSEQIFQPENASPTQQSSAVEAQRDEFLGLVKPEETFGESATDEKEVATATPEEIKQTAVQTETVKTENEIGTAEEFVLENNDVSQTETVKDISKTETVKNNIEADKTLTTAQNNSRSTTQTKSESMSVTTKEPFEFGKCTVNLNLTLFPSSGSDTSRKVIISIASHQLPPEIEYLEIESGEDLEQIAALVKNKLAHFGQTLPVKYIEQLRASKNKTEKRTPPPVNNQTSGEKTSGEQKTNSTTNKQNEAIAQASTAEKTGEPTSIISPPATSTSNAQMSLF